MKRNFYFGLIIIIILALVSSWLLWSRQLSGDGWLSNGDNGVTVYRNGRYDFSLIFPRSWSEVRVREVNDPTADLTAVWVAELPYQNTYQPIFFMEMRTAQQWQEYLQPYVKAGQYFDPADPKFFPAAKTDKYIFSFSRVVELPESLTDNLTALPGIFKTLQVK